MGRPHGLFATHLPAHAHVTHTRRPMVLFLCHHCIARRTQRVPESRSPWPCGANSRFAQQHILPDSRSPWQARLFCMPRIPPHACQVPSHYATESRRADPDTPDSRGAGSRSPRADACGPAARTKLKRGGRRGRCERERRGARGTCGRQREGSGETGARGDMTGEAVDKTQARASVHAIYAWNISCGREHTDARAFAR